MQCKKTSDIVTNIKQRCIVPLLFSNISDFELGNLYENWMM